MADLPSYPDLGGDTGEDTDVGSDRGSTYSTPRWVKVFGIILIVVLVLLFLIQHLVFEGMGGHML
jgi:hypothetical protein